MLYGLVAVLVGRTAGDLQSNHLPLHFGQSSAKKHSVTEIVPIQQPGDLDPGEEIFPMSILNYQAAASHCCSLMHHLPGTRLLVTPSPFTQLWPAFWCLFNLLFLECAIIALQRFFQIMRCLVTARNRVVSIASSSCFCPFPAIVEFQAPIQKGQPQSG